MATGGAPADEADAAVPLLAAVAHLEQAVGAVRSLVGDDTAWRSTDRDVLAAVRLVSEARAGLDEVHLRLVRQVDERGVASASPVATSPEGFLRTACLVTPGQARRDVAAARATATGAPLERFGRALAEGRTTRDHVDLAVRCLDGIPRAVLGRPGATDEVVDYLLLATAGATPLDLKEAVAHLLSRLAPDPDDRLDEWSFERRFLDIATDATGMTVGRFQLDPVAGAALRTLLQRWSGPNASAPSDAMSDATADAMSDATSGRADADADVSASLHEPASWGVENGAPGEPDRRQPRQRRADALAHVVQVALGVEGPHRGERPRVVVHVTPEQLAESRRLLRDEGPTAGPGLPEVEGQGPVPTWAARALSCDAVLQRVVMSPTEAPLELGRTERLAGLAQRRALAARDGGCVVAGCTAPPQVCDAHHVQHWADGGATDVDNLCLLCPAHHTAVHAGTWSVSIDHEGQVWVTPPPWVDRSRRPRPAWRQRARRTRRAA